MKYSNGDGFSSCQDIGNGYNGLTYLSAFHEGDGSGGGLFQNDRTGDSVGTSFGYGGCRVVLYGDLGP